jgi:uncharacterized membrane protein YqjE
MFHPLIRLLATKPHLVAQHLGGYADLAAAQAADAAQALQRRLLLGAGLAACLLVGVGMGGMALLLVAALPLEKMPAPWLLLVVPAVPLLGAAMLGWRLKSSPGVWSLSELRGQFLADMQLLDEAGRA